MKAILHVVPRHGDPLVLQALLIEQDVIMEDVIQLTRKALGSWVMVSSTFMRGVCSTSSKGLFPR